MNLISERRYDREARHNLKSGQRELVERAEREARDAGVAFTNQQAEVAYEDGKMVVRFYEKN